MKRLFVAVGLLLLLGWGRANAVGFQWASAPDPDGAKLQMAIWYPSADKATASPNPAFDMAVAVNGTVAVNGAVAGGTHPLIVMSHGTGGMALNSYDTAMALARAGFVVAAVTHTGDNYQDHSTSFTGRNFADRPRHISRVIDFMLRSWPGRGAIDPARIGMFGHSAGGATALLVAGGIADMNRELAFCQTATDDWGCRQVQQLGTALTPGSPALVTAADARVRAIVIAAPAIPNAFEPDGLRAVKVPVQLWVGAHDAIVTNATLVRTLLPTPPDYHVVANGGHFAYLSPCNDLLARSAPEICTNPPGFDRAAFLHRFQQSVIAFYRDHLR
jgi:predicted dienelactone hydrolase